MVVLCVLTAGVRLEAQPAAAGQADADAQAEKLVRDWLRKADDLFNRGLTDDARRIYVRVMEAGPETELGTQACGGLLLTFAAPGGLAIDDCREWAAKNLDREWVERLEIAAGQWYVKRRRYDEAVQLLTAVAEGNGGNRDAARALIARAQRERDEAAAELARNVSGPVAMREVFVRVPEAKGGPSASALAGLGQASAAEMTAGAAGRGPVTASGARVTLNVQPVETAAGAVAVASVGVAPRLAGDEGPGVVHVGSAGGGAVGVTQPALPVSGASVEVRGSGIAAGSPAMSMAESVASPAVGTALRPVGAAAAVTPVAGFDAPQTRVGLAREATAWSGAFATAPAPLALTPAAAERQRVSPEMMPASMVQPVRGGAPVAAWTRGGSPGTAAVGNAPAITFDGLNFVPYTEAVVPMGVPAGEPVRGGASVAAWTRGGSPGTAAVGTAPAITFDGFNFVPYTEAVVPMGVPAGEPVRGGAPASAWTTGAGPAAAWVGESRPVAFSIPASIPYAGAVQPGGALSSGEVVPRTGTSPGAIGMAAATDVAPSVPGGLVRESGWSGSLAGLPPLLAPARGAFGGYAGAPAVTTASPSEIASGGLRPPARYGAEYSFDHLALAFVSGATPSIRETIAGAQADALQSDIVPESRAVSMRAWSAPAGVGAAAAVEAAQIGARGWVAAAYWGGGLAVAPPPQALVPDARPGGRPSPGVMSPHVARVGTPTPLAPEAGSPPFPAVGFDPVRPAGHTASYAGGVAFATGAPGAPVAIAGPPLAGTSGVGFPAPGAPVADGAVRIGEAAAATGSARVASAGSAQEIPWSLRAAIGPAPTATGEAAQWNAEKLEQRISAELMKSGEKLLKDGRLEAARDAFRRVLTLDKTGGAGVAADRLLRTFGSADKPDVEACRAWAAQYVPAGVHREWLDVALAEALYRQQALDKAAALVGPIADGASPARCAALLVRAMCAMQSGDRAAALSSLAVIRADPAAGRTGPRALFLIGWLNLQAQDYRQAEAALSEFVKRYPDDPLARRARELLTRIAAATAAEGR